MKNTPSGKDIRTNSIDFSEIQTLWAACFDENAAQSLAQLIPLAKKQRVQAWIKEQPNYATLRSILQSDRPKVRKNVARLLGQLTMENDLPSLIDALEKEETLFVVPSLILSIGMFPCEEARVALQASQDRYQHFSITPENKKHYDEIMHALSKARNQFAQDVPCTFLGFPSTITVLGTAMRGCGDLLAEEASEQPLSYKQKQDHLLFSSHDFHSVSALRCAEEFLIPLSQHPFSCLDFNNDRLSKSEINVWIEMIQTPLRAFVSLAEQSFQCDALRYRIELRYFPHRYRAMIAMALEQSMQKISSALTNATTQYHLELRMEYHERKNQCDFYAKSFIPPDERFAYRVDSLPASIHPVTAASLLRFAKPFLRPNATVMDPCCGSATLLIERNKLVPTSALVGIDKNNTALSIARKNAKMAETTIDLIGGRLETFHPNQPFDEVIANLPFGTRVGTHEEIQSLHQSLFRRLSDFLTPKGVAVLYTTQQNLVRQLANRHGYTICQSRPFYAGGLIPHGFILQKKSF